MCLAQEHNAVAPVKLKPATPQSQVKHSTTEPLAPILYGLTKQKEPPKYTVTLTLF